MVSLKLEGVIALLKKLTFSTCRDNDWDCQRLIKHFRETTQFDKRRSEFSGKEFTAILLFIKFHYQLEAV